MVQAGLSIMQDPTISKITKAKGAAGVIQVAKCLPSKQKALSSNSQCCQKQIKTKNPRATTIIKPSEATMATLMKVPKSWVPVAHAYNSSYLGGKNQEGCRSKSAQASSSPDPITKILNTKKGLAEYLKW
jgi:hypothetical protein